MKTITTFIVAITLLFAMTIFVNHGWNIPAGLIEGSAFWFLALRIVNWFETSDDF